MAIADDAVELFGEESLFSRYDEYWRIRDKFFRNFTFPANIYTALFYENLIPTFSCVICRSAALKSCSFDYIYAPHLDRSLWLQICRKNRFFHIPEVLTYWRIHPGSCISRENRAYRRNFLQKTYSLLRPCYEHAPWNWSFAAAYCRFILVNIKRSLNNRRTGK